MTRNDKSRRARRLAATIYAPLYDGSIVSRCLRRCNRVSGPRGSAHRRRARSALSLHSAMSKRPFARRSSPLCLLRGAIPTMASRLHRRSTT